MFFCQSFIVSTLACSPPGVDFCVWYDMGSRSFFFPLYRYPVDLDHYWKITLFFVALNQVTLLGNKWLHLSESVWCSNLCPPLPGSLFWIVHVRRWGYFHIYGLEDGGIGSLGKRFLVVSEDALNPLRTCTQKVQGLHSLSGLNITEDRRETCILSLHCISL